MNAKALTVDVRITIEGVDVASWRLRLLGLVARWLRIPLDVR